MLTGPVITHTQGRGTAEDEEVGTRMLRCGWGVVRDMNWFLNKVLGVMMDVILDVIATYTIHEYIDFYASMVK
jgi:hypothetical protein